LTSVSVTESWAAGRQKIPEFLDRLPGDLALAPYDGFQTHAIVWLAVGSALTVLRWMSTFVVTSKAGVAGGEGRQREGPTVSILTLKVIKASADAGLTASTFGRQERWLFPTMASRWWLAPEDDIRVADGIVGI